MLQVKVTAEKCLEQICHLKWLIILSFNLLYKYPSNYNMRKYNMTIINTLSIII